MTALVTMTIPGDVSVAGFDDIPLASYLWPSRTTIRQPIQDLASAATNLLLNKLGRKNGDVEQIVKSKLVVRDSTGPA